MTRTGNLQATWQRLPAVSAFSGMTSFWLHGLEIDPCNPIEATSPVECKRVGISAVVVADMALHARLTTVAELEAWAGAHPGRPGVKRLRHVIALSEPAAESPMESRLRMLLVRGRLPKPKAQVAIHDAAGRFVGRVDLYYERCRLAIEYDGAGHRDGVTEDNRRQNRLLAVGIRLLRFTARDVLGNPDSVVAQVRAAVGTKRASSGGLGVAIGTKRESQMKTIAS